MGCVVNGPGEAREADIAVCGGDGEALLLRAGKPCGKIAEQDIIPTLIAELEKYKQ
jgi:(E)-4-hydroxy-3-methylbut-2-enyl-diphosphate synthase